MNKKGFTLIELLAVIVILAIIALIAVPIVLGIIEDARKSATLRSAEFYLKGVQQSIALSMLNGKAVADGEHTIMSTGDICLGTYTKNGTNESCLDDKGNNATLKVEVDGATPTEGKVKIEQGQIKDMSLYLNETDIVMQDGKLVYDEPQNNDGGNQTITYQFGEQVKFNPGDGEKTWYIIDYDDTTVTLILNENLGDTVEWIKQSDYNDDTTWTGNYAYKGPITALKTLNTLTTNWGNVDPIQSYNYQKRDTFYGTVSSDPYHYQKLEITNGTSVLTHKDGGTTTIDGVTRARMLSYEDLQQLLTINTREENLEAFLERNMESLKTVVSSQIPDPNILTELEAATTVDDILEFAGKYMEPQLASAPRWNQLYSVVNGCTSNFSIETTYDLGIHIPEFINGKFWLLTASGNSSAYIVDSDYGNSKYTSYDPSESNRYSIRPVITIPKSKLS